MKNPVTDKLIAAIKSQAKPPPDKDEIAFLRDFYHRLSGQDFTARKALEFREAAQQHRRLGTIRAVGETLIAIYNPTAGGDDEETTRLSIIAEDKPFIIDSMVIKLNAMRKTPHRITHPSFVVRRDKRRRMTAMTRFKGALDSPQPGEKDREKDPSEVESYIQLSIDFTPPGEHSGLLRELHEVMADIEIVVADWAKMRAKTLGLAAEVEQRGGAEHGQLLRWMENHHFAFLGYAELVLDENAGEGAGENIAKTAKPTTTIDQKSALGVLRAAYRHGESAALDMLPTAPPGLPSAVMFGKSRQRSAIHRANYPDCILIEREAVDGGRRVGCLLGFLAGASAALPTASIPLLRDKVAYVLKTSTLRPGGYAYKSLRTVLDTLPRENLFQMEKRALYGLCMTVLNHLARRKTRLHLHRNFSGHFYSCLVYIPRDLFNSQLRQRIQTYLGAQLAADEVSFDVYFSDSILTRIHYLAHCRTRPDGAVDGAALEHAVQAMARDWNDNLYEALRRAGGSGKSGGHELANQTLALYRDAFPSHYQDDFTLDEARLDITRFAGLDGDHIHAALAPRSAPRSAPHPAPEAPHSASFKIYARHHSIALSDALPILRHMGIRVLGERPYRIRRTDGIVYWLHDFEITRHDQQAFDVAAGGANFEATFTQAWYGRIEDDGFNQLTLLAGLHWQEIGLLRACYRYLKQIRLRYSEQYIIEALANNPSLVVSIMALFKARFEPANQRKNVAKSASKSLKSTPEQALKNTIEAQLEQVAMLDEDRIIRALLDVIDATLRTNYYQTDAAGDPKPYLALKLNPSAIPRLPKPAPKYEIFVCSPRLEGVHLRGGAVARGGLRWSERPEDFRTEALALAKAQRVKNAVIVPVGSKGAFVAKRLPDMHAAAHQDIQREVVACYRLFISGLLDVTDNLDGARVLPPAEVVRMDGDDPYLVVAADKGTATFSDIANEIAIQYGFWLGDAFASGGSAGYDHKKMGITARGAWESVKRHFRELNKDIQSADFTVVGIGDMAGDVFGNGMLLSEHIRLLAAFNHRHIFLDPNPDAALSYAERRRLFERPRSAWSDYDAERISAGGGVFARDAKSIALSPQAQKALGATKRQYAPDDLINLILRAEVELLWNGGIGTYVKASAESHAAAQDKHNDGVRVSARELRCRVIGEGGNLGMTQLARIEYAAAGGLCYTDAIDNSAGVNTSDYEVNIKILLNAAMQAKRLTPGRRDAVLAKMEAQVGRLALRNNYTQSQAISLEAARGERLMAQHARAIEALEARGLLNRAMEFLPDAAAIAERRETGQWLTRPELAVLLSYSKMDLYQALLASEVPDEACLASEIDRYFPPQLAKNYLEQVRAHRLRREIISTQITNDVVDVMGPSFHLRLGALAGFEAAAVTRAYLIARDVLDAATLRAAIEALDNRVAAELQISMLAQVSAALSQCALWLLKNRPAPLDIDAQRAVFTPGCAQLAAALKKILGGAVVELAKHAKHLTERGAPAALAQKVAALPYLGYAVDIVAIAAPATPAAPRQGAQNRALIAAAGMYFQVRETLDIAWVERAIDALPSNNDWHERAQFSLAHELRASHAAITAAALRDHSAANLGVKSGAESAEFTESTESTESAESAAKSRAKSTQSAESTANSSAESAASSVAKSVAKSKVKSGDKSRVKSAKSATDSWRHAHRDALAAIAAMTADIKAEPHPDFAMLSVLVSGLSRLH